MPFYRSTNISSGRQIAYYSTEAAGSRAPEGTLALLMHFDGANGSTTFTDSSPFNHTVSRGSTNTVISTAQSKFGGSSVLFDGTDLLTLPTGNTSTNPFCLGLNDFTFECFIRISNLATSNLWEVQGNPSSFAFYITGSKLYWYEDALGSVAASTTLSTNTWYHVAVTRLGTTLKIWLDGNQDLSVTSTGDLASSSLTQNTIGAGSTGASGFDGYMDELRIIRGLAVYTSSFVPPTSPFS